MVAAPIPSLISARFRATLVFSGLIFFQLPDFSFAEISESNVLVLYDADAGPTGDGFQIAQYYQQQRPGVHLFGLQGISDILSGAFQETVSAEDYLSEIRPQVLSAIASIGDTIDVIVTTKGLPLRIDAGNEPAGETFSSWKRYSSLESELTRVDTIDSVEAMGEQFFFPGFPDLDPTRASNPYYNDNVPFSTVGSDPINGDIRLAARLDGYDVQTVKASLDRAQQVFVVPQQHYVVADDDPCPKCADQIVDTPDGQGGGGPGPSLITVLQNIGQAFVSDFDQIDSVQNEAITVAPGPVIGYVSHGTNDGAGGLGSDYVQGQLNFELAKGSVFLTHESFNAQSFDPASTQADGMIADWLEIGGTAGLGHVAEGSNGPDNVANEDLFYQMLLPSAGALPGESGLTFVEAAWNATRQLSSVNTVVGDPLMKFQAWLPGDANLDGKVEFNDFFTLEENWGQLGNFAEGDFDGDGVVDEDDFDILQQNWLSSAGLLANSASNIVVYPTLDAYTGWPALSATLLSSANLDQDLDVDGDDLASLMASYGVDDGGDVNGDGVTDGTDFLLWQQQYVLYTYTADFDIDAHVGTNDLEIWENSFGTNRGGDANGDGVTDGFDFLAWQREVTVQTALITSASASVPEPCGMFLVFAGVLVLAYPSRAIRCRLPSAG